MVAARLSHLCFVMSPAQSGHAVEGALTQMEHSHPEQPFAGQGKPPQRQREDPCSACASIAGAETALQPSQSLQDNRNRNVMS